MNNKGKTFNYLSTFSLVLLWVYAAISKLIDFDHFKHEMHIQMLFPIVQILLIYFLPITELITALLLVFEETHLKGLYTSLVLMTLFTGYIILVLMHVFRHVPCSCGGILEHMSWFVHLFFNLFFLALILTTIFIFKRKELR